MGKIQETFRELRAAGRAALMPYLTMGYPHFDSALSLVPTIAEAGADLIELGLPFSDPLADGATIQAASQRALESGITLATCLRQVQDLRRMGVTVPFVLMGYYNPIFQLGVVRFAREARASGVDGIIIPDLPLEEAAIVQSAFEAQELDLIFLVAPTSDAKRIQAVAAQSSGFIYLVSLVGVTGTRDQLDVGLTDLVRRVRALTDKPLAVGFGISTPEQAGAVARLADGVIVGSALVKAVGDAEDPVTAAAHFVTSLRRGVDAARLSP